MFIDRLNNDYYPFGMTVPNRTYQSPEYRYGFQGQEKDDEVKGSGNSVNYKFRMHDPRVGRFFAVDPLEKKYPWYTPYQFSGNKVIHMIELEGLEETETKDKKDKPYSGNIKPYEVAEANNEIPDKGPGFSIATIEKGGYSIRAYYITNENGVSQLSHYIASTTINKIKDTGGLK